MVVNSSENFKGLTGQRTVKAPKRKCVICGGSLAHKKNGSLYCSDSCTDKAAYQRRKVRRVHS